MIAADNLDDESNGFMMGVGLAICLSGLRDASHRMGSQFHHCRPLPLACRAFEALAIVVFKPFFGVDVRVRMEFVEQ